MRHEDEEPIDRDAWRRRLGDAGAPPAATDFVIRAEARRVLTPRTSRWWLPASLAAAVVLAVLLAQLQVEDERLHPLLDESQIHLPGPPAALPAPEAPAPDESGAASSMESEAFSEPPAAGPPPEGESGPPPMFELPRADVARERSAESQPADKLDNAAPPPPPAPPETTES